MNIPNINDIPKELREDRNKECSKCQIRKDYARYLDVHFDWWDCPYDCKNDLEHLLDSYAKQGGF